MPPEDDRSMLERAKERLYSPTGMNRVRQTFKDIKEGTLPHEWKEQALSVASSVEQKHVRLASRFFMVALAFFFFAVALAGYFFYFGGNTVSTDKITLDIKGPTSISGGDTVPLVLTITNRNPVTIKNADIEIEFPEGTRNAEDVLASYPRYTEDLGEIRSGETITRSIKAIIFAGAGETLAVPVSVSFRTQGSNAVFVKKETYELSISSTPLSVSVDTLAETVSGKQMPVTLTVRSNATTPLTNVVLNAGLPFGFRVASSSVPMANSSFLLGNMEPGAQKTISFNGALEGQNGEERVFKFTVGTARSPGDSTIAVTYMTQEVTVAITAPFIHTSLTLDGNPFENAVMSPGSQHQVTLSYNNTLSTNITNATVRVSISGSAIDYGSIKSSRGFYDSSTKSVVFNSDNDPGLASLAPGASGIGAFSFSTLQAGSISGSPTIAFTLSVAGTRVGQTSVPEAVSDTVTYTARVATAVSFSAAALHSSGPLSNTGPIPPRAEETTSYTIVWTIKNNGNAIAGATVTAVLPSYVIYTDAVSGKGEMRFDETSRMVTWNAGDLPGRGSAQGAFQVAIKPSTSQRGSSPMLVGQSNLSAFDRFAGIQVAASNDPVTTETPGDPGYVSTNGTVQ